MQEKSYYPWNNKVLNLSKVIHEQLSNNEPNHCLIGGMAVNFYILGEIVNKRHENLSNLIKNHRAVESLSNLFRDTKDLDYVYKKSTVDLIDDLGQYAKFFELQKKEVRIGNEPIHASFYTKEDNNVESWGKFFELLIDNSKQIIIPYNNKSDLIVRVPQIEELIASKLIPFRQKDIKDILLLNSYFKFDKERLINLLNDNCKKGNNYVDRFYEIFPNHQ